MTSPAGKIAEQRAAFDIRRRQIVGQYYGEVRKRDILKVITDACDKASIPYMRNYNSKVITAKDGQKQLTKIPEHQLGKPDLTVLCYNKLTIWIETKAPDGILSDDQKRWRQWIESRGHEYHAPRTSAEAHNMAARILEVGR